LDGNNVAAKEGLRRVFQALHPTESGKPIEPRPNQAKHVD
jgi:hypothetical protein